MKHSVLKNRSAARRWSQQLAFASLAVLGSSAHADLKVVDGVLVESNGTPLVMRGVNVAHAWYPDKTAQSLKDISARGANSVRLVLANGVKWPRTTESEVALLISQAKAAKMIAVLEVHDTTGYGEQSGMSTLDQAADYWIGIKSALIGQEDYVIVNIGNEPFGNGPSATAWIDGHKNAIAKLRAAGIKNTLMVDGANWGQDWQGIMKTNAAQVFASDSLKNTVFSVHMYSVYASDSAVNDYLTTFLSAKLPIVVGEFGNAFQGQAVAATAIMSRAKQYGIGYLGWSWSGNGGSDAPLDLVNNFNGSNPSSWGELLFNEANGITATSTRASIFGDNITLPGVPAPTAAAGNGSVVLSWSAVSGANAYEVARSTSASGGFSTIATGLTTSTYTDSGLRNGTPYYYKVSARNASGVATSSEVSATPKADTTAPMMPNVSANAGDGKVSLSWSAATNVSRYVVARSLAASGGYTTLSTLDGAATSYIDAGLTNGTPYYYHVTASNSTGESPVASVVATPKAATVAACTLTVDSSNDWGSGQVARVVLSNTGSTSIDNWALSITENSDFSLDSTWNANFAKSGRTLSVTPVKWSRTIPPGQRVEAGMQLSYSGARPVPTSASAGSLGCTVSLK